ncbi:MAG: ATP-binding protein [Treponema sp.]|nr:ATP-binding protein [Treponema sp.]
MLYEKQLIDELNRFDRDEIFARSKCGLPTEGKLEDQDLKYFEFEKQKVRDRMQEELKKVQEWNKTKASNVPLRFSESSFFNFECRTEEDQKVLTSVIKFVESEKNEGVLILTGKRGTGKTHLGTAAVRDKLGSYIVMEDLIYKVESSLNFKSNQTEEEVFNDFSTKGFLVIDEIGRSLKREKEIEILSYILRKRYDNRLPTIIITNLEKKVLLRTLGEAVADRLCEIGSTVEFTGESYRVLRRKAMNAAA